MWCGDIFGAISHESTLEILVFSVVWAFAPQSMAKFSMQCPPLEVEAEKDLHFVGGEEAGWLQLIFAIGFTRYKSKHF